MKSRKIFAGVLLLVWIVCGCEGRKASAWWFGESLQLEKPDISSTNTCVTPVTNIMGGDPKIGALTVKYGWGIVKGCWRAWNAPEGEKWKAFIDGYKEATTTTEGEIAGLVGGVIAY